WPSPSWQRCCQKPAGFESTRDAPSATVRALQSAGAIGLPTSPHAHIRDNHRGHVSRRAWPGARVVDPRLLEASLIVTFTTIHWVGLRTGSAVTQLITLAVALLLLAVVGACLVATPVHGSAITPL